MSTISHNSRAAYSGDAGLPGAALGLVSQAVDERDQALGDVAFVVLNYGRDGAADDGS